MHISEVSHERIPSVAKVLKVDEVVQAKVLSVDAGRSRISLSIKALKDAPVRPESAGDDQGRAKAEPAREEDPAVRKLRAKFGGKTPMRGGMDSHGALGTYKIQW